MLTLLVLLMTSTAPGVAAPDVAARDEIRALHALFVEAARARDRATLERIYADEFLFIHASGMIQDKASWIGGLLAVEKYNDAFKPDFEDLQVYGDTALLRIRGARFGTTIYAKKGGRWQIIQVQSTTVPPARTAVAVDGNVLESYVGKCKSDARTTVVTKEGPTLKVQADGRPPVLLVPDSDAHFFVKDAFAEITFFKDEAGKVTHFVHKLDGRETSWQKAD